MINLNNKLKSFQNRDKLNIIIITKNKGIEFLKVSADQDFFIYDKTKRFLIDNKAILIKKNRRYLIYYEEKPKPLLPDEALKSLKMQGISSLELDKLFKPQLLKSLIPQVSMLNFIIMILVVASCLICIYLVVEFGDISKSQAKVLQENRETKDTMINLVTYLQSQFLPYMVGMFTEEQEQQKCCCSVCPFISFVPIQRQPITQPQIQPQLQPQPQEIY